MELKIGQRYKNINTMECVIIIEINANGVFIRFDNYPNIHKYNVHDFLFVFELLQEITVSDSQTATKDDSGKNPLELLPISPLLMVGEVLAFGAIKYKPNDWRKGLKWTRLIGAIMRHLFDFMMGIDKDKDSGLHPLAHACCDIMFLLEYIAKDLGDDDRYKYKNTKQED